uniref:Uncharacterized protein n=1 Tax=Varanus komodoensis TaxID=61221 RepID=A0A8D2IKV5_VARKO
LFWAELGAHAFPPPPTGDLHHAVLGLHHQLLRGKVVDVQCHFPALGCLPDLRDAAAELAAQCSAVGRVGGWRRGDGDGDWAGHHGLRAGAEHGAHIARPAGGPCRPLVPVLRDKGHPERLVEKPAAPVPVPERVPAGVAEESEGNLAFRHAQPRRLRPATVCTEQLAAAGPYQRTNVYFWTRMPDFY